MTMFRRLLYAFSFKKPKRLISESPKDGSTLWISNDERRFIEIQRKKAEKYVSISEKFLKDVQIYVTNRD